ncbi:MAG TPA: lipocalin family protein, partial [Chloroflexota bacterium]|nr:lipocalin family protein [Chloroflexota bacterium]
DNGVISFGPVGDSYYYSSTRATITGTIVDHGVNVPVTGEAWKDRQWGNFLASPGGGWDWLSLQLSDRTELMIFILRGLDGTSTPSSGTMVRPDGTTQSLRLGATRVMALGHWQSPHTGTAYPSGWSVELPEQGLAVQAEPVIADQELDTRASTGTIYWEGEVDLIGTNHGNAVSGWGYVELTGYAASRP